MFYLYKSASHKNIFLVWSVLLISLLFLLPIQSNAASQTFSGPGTYNLSLSGVNQITVSGSGGGGGGAGGAWDSNFTSPGNGGGGGAAAVSNNVINIPNGNTSLTVVVGGGGQGGPANWNIGSWQSGSSGGTTYLYVNGGLVLTLPGGGSPVMWAGGDYLNTGGASGGAGGEAGAWGDRGCGGSGGKGGDSLFGTGGAAVYGIAVPGNNGIGYGSGGSGASGGCDGNGGGPGGYGATGVMTISWTSGVNPAGSASTPSSFSPKPLLPAGLCSPYYFCSGNDVYYKSLTCKESLYEKCQYGCSGGTCLPPPTIEPVPFSASNSYGAFVATGHLQVKPLLVQKGNPIWVYWKLENVSSCTVSGTNGDFWTGSFSGYTGKISSPINGQTTYTLSCAALPGVTPASVTETQVVNVIPSFQEK